MKTHPANRLLAFVLALVMVLGLVPVSGTASGLVWNETDLNIQPDQSHRLVTDKEPAELHAPTDTVRVSIVLEDDPTAGAGFATRGIALDEKAVAYDQALSRNQKAMEQTISAQALGGKKLDVVWNLTLVANIISANVPYGSLDAIRAVPGVKEVRLERKYSPDTAEKQTYTSGGMTGAVDLWQSGYTGAGSRIAIVDTGTDTDHQSFNNGAFLHALRQNAAQRGMSYESYLNSIDLLDTGDVNRVLRQLNVTERIGYDDASSYYLNEKLPFAANYVDRNLVVDHDHDYQGSHGSHVAGIAAANRFIPSPKGNGYVDALQEVSMAGMAPDAQILTMKVFGNNPGPYESDYFAAIEDAIWLGCDSVNLSLGSGNPGSSYNDAFADLLAFLETTDTVVVMSAGNSGQWAEKTVSGRLYDDGVSFHTGGEPGTYTNSLTVASVNNSGQYPGNDYAISSFSSWGVPGSLELKPEITAPGGNIWSVNGVDPSGSAYEYMSGTSMAAPHVTGMAAQLGQYIRERGLQEQTGLSPRHLAQSLLMSTAVPLRNQEAGGSYTSLMAQGAGFARVDLAASAESYVMVEGQYDGKVKVELGEDARREGAYTFSFTLNNLTNQPLRYDLRADLFTQNVYDGGSARYLSGSTRNLASEAVFTSGGTSLADLGGYKCDLNGDGITNFADADYLLEYLVGNATKLYADGDVNGDGSVNTYDAHALLSKHTGRYLVEVPADGSVAVEVTVTLTDETRELLDTEYPTGAYIEGVVCADPESGVSHSIPVLGYYGSWTEPSMFDVGGYAEHEARAETRAPYLYNLHGIRSNFVSITHGGDEEYLFGGNPYVREAEYLPQRNAFNNQKGYMLQHLRFSLIRNASDTRLILENLTTDEQLFEQELGAYGGAYYHVNSGSWTDTQYQVGLGLDLAGIQEGTMLQLRLEAAPELYRMADGSVEWRKLEEGGILTTTFTIDNTAPRVLNIRQEGSELQITATDNQYVAAVALMNASGTGTLTVVPGNQTAPHTDLTARLELSGIYGDRFLVAVYDYAGNVTVCEARVETEQERPRFTAVDRATGDWYGLEPDGTCVQLTSGGSTSVQAAEYVDGYVFLVDGDNRLHVASDSDLYGFRFLSELDPRNEYRIASFNDLAYSTADEILYGIFYSELNGQEESYLCKIDVYTGELTVLGTLSADICAMTIDGEGRFYGVPYGSAQLYTFYADAVTTGKFTRAGGLGGYNTTSRSPMAWDQETDELFWAQVDSSGTELLQVRYDSGVVEPLCAFSFKAAGLYIAGSTVGNTFAPTDRVSSVRLTKTANTIAGGQVQLSAQVLPWNIRDDSVTWSSGNQKVATVDANGVVTGVSGGTAVITATSRLDSSKKASCTVTVEAVDTTLKGIVWDEEGQVWFSSFNTGSLPAYNRLAAVDKPLTATAYLKGTMYASSLDVSTGISDVYTVDPNTFSLRHVGMSSIAYADLCGAPNLGCLVGTYFNYLVLVDPESGDYFAAWDWSENLAGDLVGVTYTGSEYHSYYQAWMDTFLLLDNRGNVYQEALIRTDGQIGYFNGPEEGYVGSMGEAVDASYYQGFHFDGSDLYWSRFNEVDNIVELRMMDVLGNGSTYRLGYFPEGGWPVGGLYTDEQLGSNALTAEFAQMTMREQCFTEELTPVAAGGLNAVETDSDAGLDMFDSNYVNVTYDRDTTNGILRVEYDADKLSFAGMESATAGYAIREEEGAVEVAFAHGKAISAGKLITSLSFRALPGVLGGETTVTIRTQELGQETVNLVETVTMELPLPHNPFDDVEEGRFYYVPVLWAVQNGITYGITDTYFGIDEPCKRSQVVTFLWRAAGSPAPQSTENRFVDVKKGSFYEKAVLWAVENGITVGIDATHFDPDAPCTRSAVVTFLWRAAGKPAASGSIPFKDVPANAWYAQPVLWAVQNGITYGMTNTEFGTEGTCTRGQVVTFLYRTLA